MRENTNIEKQQQQVNNNAVLQIANKVLMGLIDN